MIWAIVYLYLVGLILIIAIADYLHDRGRPKKAAANIVAIGWPVIVPLILVWAILDTAREELTK